MHWTTLQPTCTAVQYSFDEFSAGLHNAASDRLVSSQKSLAVFNKLTHTLLSVCI
jgi:excinuclease UvrABC ATPase subunit